MSDPLGGVRAFGSVSISAAAAASTITLSVAGATAVVSGFTPSGAGCGEFTATALVNGMPVSDSNIAILHNGETLTVDVTYDPVDRVDVCTITVQDDDGNVDSFQLTGDGTAPQLMVTPGMLAFDDQEWNGGTPQVLNVSIENVGEESIAMDDLTVVLTTGTQFMLGAVSPLPIDQGETAILGLLDVDGVNGAKALTYGLLLLRYLFGFRGATLVTGAVENGCSRCTPETIEPYIAGLL